jgi:thiosulfate/3-mercaptopyruvate sulfurtransferase
MNASASPLIDVATLSSELAGESAPVLLDARWRLGGPPGVISYLAGHLPGAVYVDLDRDLAGLPGAGGRHPLPAVAAFQTAMRRSGVSAGRPVVAYDDGDSIPAARAWWTLRYFGHQQVRVLDGGFSAWAAAGLPVTADEPVAAAGDFTAVPGGMPVVDADGAAELARSGILLDVRTAERYRGETEPIDPVAGHIPGALSAPVTASMTSGGRFRSPAELAQRPSSALPPDARPAPIAARASPPRTRCWPSPWQACPLRSTSDPGPAGLPILAARLPSARTPVSPAAIGVSTGSR